MQTLRLSIHTQNPVNTHRTQETHCLVIVPRHFNERHLKTFSNPYQFIVDPENKFTFSEIYVIVYDYGIFHGFTQTRP